MKTKKILAIVTLVAFMISILPMAAFAATAVGTNQYTSTVEVKEASAAADGTDEIEIEVMTKNATFGAGDATYEVYVATSRPTADKINTLAYPTVALTAEKLTADANGKITVKLTSLIPGTTNVVIGLDSSEVYKYAIGAQNSSAGLAQALKTGEGVALIPVTFTAPSANACTIITASKVVGFANDSDNVEISAKLTATSGAPVAGKEITFSTDLSGARFSAIKATTGTDGVAKVKLYAVKPGTYGVTAKGEGKTSAAVAFTFNPVGVYTIAAESDNNQLIAKGDNVDLKFSFTDGVNNYKVTTGAGANYDVDTTVATPTIGATSPLKDIKFTTIAEPSGAAIADTLAIGTDCNVSVDGSNLKLTIKNAVLDKEGNYSIKTVLANGKSVTYNFTVKKFGDAKTLTISYDNSVLGAGSVSAAPSAKLVDENGVKQTAGLLTYTVDNATLATIGVNTGILTSLGNDKTGVVLVTAIDSTNKLVATTTVTFAKAPAALKVTAPTYNKVGETAKVTIQLIDIDGKAIANGQAIGLGATATYVLSSPAGSIANATVPAGTDFAKNGQASIDVTCNVVGEVKVQVIIQDAAARVFVGNGTVVFGEVAPAQQNLTMFIGSKNYMVGSTVGWADAAPFILNGRTYVAARPIGQAIGAVIGWNDATKTATLTIPGQVITIGIGSSNIIIDRAGVITNYPTDAPAMIKDGRTYLPFRAIGEAMGYTVNWDAATGAVTFVK